MNKKNTGYNKVIPSLIWILKGDSSRHTRKSMWSLLLYFSKKLNRMKRGCNSKLVLMLQKDAWSCAVQILFGFNSEFDLAMYPLGARALLLMVESA